MKTYVRLISFELKDHDFINVSQRYPANCICCLQILHTITEKYYIYFEFCVNECNNNSRIKYICENQMG